MKLFYNLTIFSVVTFFAMQRDLGLAATRMSSWCIPLETEMRMQCSPNCPGQNSESVMSKVANARRELTDVRFGSDLAVNVFDNETSRTITEHFGLVGDAIGSLSISSLELIKRNLGHLGGNKLNVISGIASLLDSNSTLSSTEKTNIASFANHLVNEYSSLRKQDLLEECMARLSFERKLSLIFNFQKPPKEPERQRIYFLNAIEQLDYLKLHRAKPR